MSRTLATEIFVIILYIITKIQKKFDNLEYMIYNYTQIILSQQLSRTTIYCVLKNKYTIYSGFGVDICKILC